MSETTRRKYSSRVARLVSAMLAVALSLTGCSLLGPDSQTQSVIDAINAIGEVTLSSEQSIDTAKNAYDELSDNQRQKVDNYETLTSAESKLAELKEDKAREDKSKADEVISTIDAIGEVTLDKKDQISQARSSYDALSPDQKQLVSNYQALSEAEEQIEKLGQALAIGETVTTSQWSATLTDAKVSHTLESSERRTYWEAGDGTCFLIMEFDIECLTSDKPTVDDDGLTDIVATYNGNGYSNWTMQYLAGELWLYIRHTYLDANIPCHLFVYTPLPEKALNDDEAISVDLKIGGEPKTITVR